CDSGRIRRAPCGRGPRVRRARRVPEGSAPHGDARPALARETARVLAPEDLRWRCDPGSLERVVAALAREARRERGARASRSTSALPVAAHEVVGQDRALEAIRAGLA